MTQGKLFHKSFKNERSKYETKEEQVQWKKKRRSNLNTGNGQETKINTRRKIEDKGRTAAGDHLKNTTQYKGRTNTEQGEQDGEWRPEIPP